MFLLLFVVHNCRNEEINVSYVTKLFYQHFLICNPKFCINQEIKVNEGDFLIFFSDSVSESLKVTWLIYFLRFLFLTLIPNCRIQEIKLTKSAHFIYF